MKSFSGELRGGLKKRYGRLPSAAFTAIQFNRYSSQDAPVSQETTRKWMRGLSMPSYLHLKVLIVWLKLDIMKCLDLADVRLSDASLESDIFYADETIRITEILNKLPFKTLETVLGLVSSRRPS